MKRMPTFLFAMSLVTLLTLGLACESDEGSSGCEVDSQCALGKVCMGGSCGEKACDVAADCGEGRTCVDVDHDGSVECTRSDCTTTPDCATATATGGIELTCVSGACIPAKTDTPTDDVTEPDASEDSSGQDAAPDSVPVPDSVLCQPCADNADCGEGNSCLPLSEGDFCSTPCLTNDECPSGFFCFQMTSEGKACVPGLYSTCPTCLIEGCDEGQTCDQTADACKPVAGACGSCDKDEDCGLAYRCFTMTSSEASEKRCVPECGDGLSCPSNGMCKAMTVAEGTEGVNVCAPASPICCFGDNCGDCDCSGTPGTPYCDAGGACVACLSDSNCPPTASSCVQGSCVDQSSGCEAPTPYACAANPGDCCECTADEHCAGSGVGPYCDVNKGECGNDPCACVEPYPACLPVDGQVMCVQCVIDEDCPASCTCSAGNTCQNIDGSDCGTGIPPAECSDCATDADCGTAEGLELHCDAASGCCFDQAGKCDNVVAFCAPGSQCTGMMDLISLDLSALGIPTDTLGDSGAYCSCPPECLGGVGCVTADEVADAAMGDLGAILGPLLGDIGGVETYCVDLASVGDLLGGLLGGMQP